MIPGSVLLCWFACTAGLCLVAWVRAERVRAARPWLPPLLVLIASAALLLLVAWSPPNV